MVALNEGLRRKKALWRAAGRKQLEAIALAPWASRRRQDLLDLLDQLTPKILELPRALEREVEKRPVTRRLMTRPGVGPLTTRAKWRSSLSACKSVLETTLDTADIVRDGDFSAIIFQRLS